MGRCKILFPVDLPPDVFCSAPFLYKRFCIALQDVSGAAKVCFVKTNVRVREKNTFL